MLEQEKAVQFRFDTSEKGLSERLTEIGVPGFARLYSCVGLPNIFAWKNIEKTESFQETWLYIPDQALESIKTSHLAFNVSDEKYAPLSHSIRVDNKQLFPIQSGGKIICAIAVPEGKNFTPSADDIEKLEKIERSLHHTDKTDAVQIAYEFVSKLFDCKQSYAEFAQRLLGFLTDQVDRSYAGIYWKGADGFHRRWAYGDLQFSDKLPLLVSVEMVERWSDSISRGNSFIPAERVQDEPVFVQSPPTHLFVHKTARFGDREQWLVMALPGDISAAAISRITIIASLLSSLDDERTTGYTELVNMYGSLLNRQHKTPNLEEALRNCFRILDGKLRINSMCVLDTDNSVLSCTKANDNEFKIDKSKVTKIPESALKVLESFEPSFMEGPSHSHHEKTIGHEKSDESHVFVPIPIKESGTALLSVEFTSELSLAKKYTPLLELLAKYIGLCLSLSKSVTNQPQVVGSSMDEISETMALTRLRTIGKMNAGYFHELIEYLSVILGQAELMEYELKKSTKPITSESLLMSTDRIVRAAASLANRLEKLKDVSTVKLGESGSNVSAAEFLEMLPVLTYGYFLAVKDSKNVEIEVQTNSDKNTSFSIPVLHVYDFIAPLIFAVMDESICSGKLVVSLAEHFGRPVLRISYPKKLLGKLTDGKLIDKVFKFHRASKSEEGTLVVSVESAHFIFSECEGDRDRYQVLYSLTNQKHPVEEFI